MLKQYKGDIIPEPNTIFVFGSNPEGRHGAGSAKVAVNQFGAKYGQGEGLQGNSYALPTTELRRQFRYDDRYSMSLDTIISNIRKMYECAREHPELNFKIAYRNQPEEKTLCGYKGKELMGAFKLASLPKGYPENVWFSEEWINSGIL